MCLGWHVSDSVCLSVTVRVCPWNSCHSIHACIVEPQAAALGDSNHDR